MRLVQKVSDLDFSANTNEAWEVSAHGEVRATFMFIYKFFSCQKTISAAGSPPMGEGLYLALAEF